MEYPSRYIESAVEEMASLPGVGKRTALRFVMDLLRRSPEDVDRFSRALSDLHEQVQYCRRCHNLCEGEECRVCSDPGRDHKVICVVEDFMDVLAVEGSGQFKGVYHVLGGLISPMDGIGPSELNMGSLLEKIRSGDVNEVILALSTTMEGDTTNFYIYRQIRDLDVNITTIASGVAIGNELEYTDEVTLGRSIRNRTPYERTLSE